MSIQLTANNVLPWIEYYQLVTATFLPYFQYFQLHVRYVFPFCILCSDSKKAIYGCVLRSNEYARIPEYQKSLKSCYHLWKENVSISESLSEIIGKKLDDESGTANSSPNIQRVPNVYQFQGRQQLPSGNHQNFQHLQNDCNCSGIPISDQEWLLIQLWMSDIYPIQRGRWRFRKENAANDILICGSSSS